MSALNPDRCRQNSLQCFWCLFAVYLLDDVLAAVDTHVAKHIVKHCILGLLKHTTRIVVTENRLLTYNANQVLRVENGTVRLVETASESYDDGDDDDDDSYRRDNDMKVNQIIDSDKKSLDSVMLEVNGGKGDFPMPKLN